MQTKSITATGIFAVFCLYILRLLALTVIVQQAMDGNWSRVPLLVFWLLLTYSASIIGGLKKLQIPVEFEALIVAFVFATMFLGEFRNFYDEIEWWDSFLHVIGSGLMVFAGFILFTHAEKRPFLENQPLLLAFICFSFAMTIGALWEIYEFFIDMHFGLNMQPAGNADTMWDTVWNMLGALFTGMIIYLHKLRYQFFNLEKVTAAFALKDKGISGS